uniref:RNA helicase n=1 Tax=Guillardia theta TaxID=55529 RepID=A0A7S4KB97_GUITH
MSMWGEDASFEATGLDQDLIKAVRACGFERPTRIQEEAIPAILRGKNTVIGAETGSGKTLAYLLPVMQRMLKQMAEEGTTDFGPNPRALVLVPNQELAMQVALMMQRLSRTQLARDFPCVVVAGSSGLPIFSSCSILIATPSALLRYTEPEMLDQVKALVVDEADMLMQGGFEDDVRKILDYLCPRISNTKRRMLAKQGLSEEDYVPPRPPAQVIFAAATLPDWKGDKVKSIVRTLRLLFPDAVHINTMGLHRQSLAVETEWVEVEDEEESLPLLLDVLDKSRGVKTMVFCNTIASAKDTHAFLLEHGWEAHMIHKEVPPAVRAEALNLLRVKSDALVVCTDIAARGIDAPNVGHVIQLQFAPNAVTYLHRIGRTARAGSLHGKATNFIDPSSRDVATAIRKEVEERKTVAPVFSRNRGFRRRLKRSQAAEGSKEDGEDSGDSEESK